MLVAAALNGRFTLVRLMCLNIQKLEGRVIVIGLIIALWTGGGFGLLAG